jgi:hypothetical protein
LQALIQSLPDNDLRNVALNRIRRLDCADKTLASCDASSDSPQQDTTWSEALKDAAGADKNRFAWSLAMILSHMVCSGSDVEVAIVRGGGFQSRLLAAGIPATGLIEDLMNKDSKVCPVSGALTDDDRANLLQIKQRIGEAVKAGK